VKNYTMLVKFKNGAEGHVTFSSNITPENLQAKSETARQAVYYHFPDLHITEVLAVSFAGVELTPECFAKVCDTLQTLERELEHFTDGAKREGIFEAITTLRQLIHDFDIEEMSR
jgi:hypothetical protein